MSMPTNREKSVFSKSGKALHFAEKVERELQLLLDEQLSLGKTRLGVQLGIILENAKNGKMLLEEIRNVADGSKILQSEFNFGQKNEIRVRPTRESWSIYWSQGKVGRKKLTPYCNIVELLDNIDRAPKIKFPGSDYLWMGKEDCDECLIAGSTEANFVRFYDGAFGSPCRHTLIEYDRHYRVDSFQLFCLLGFKHVWKQVYFGDWYQKKRNGSIGEMKLFKKSTRSIVTEEDWKECEVNLGPYEELLRMLQKSVSAPSSILTETISKLVKELIASGLK